jgi:hypothetical protein
MSRACAIALLAALLLGAPAADTPPKVDGQALKRSFAGSADTDAFLRDPGVRAELVFLLGGSIAHLEANLYVRGEVDLVGGQLMLVGNAPHAGTEEEAVVCVAVHDGAVNAAILSAGAITVFTRAVAYDSLPLCIKDWATQVNSGHRDRFARPSNVRRANGDF